jgi:hypothetical protein
MYCDFIDMAMSCLRLVLVSANGMLKSLWHFFGRAANRLREGSREGLRWCRQGVEKLPPFFPLSS